MESAKTLLILQKCLREVPDEILLLILETFINLNTSECPQCEASFLNSKEMRKQYMKYLENSKRMFKGSSLELCYDCYNYDLETSCNYCEKCFIPFKQRNLEALGIQGVKHWANGQCEGCSKN